MRRISTSGNSKPHIVHSGYRHMSDQAAVWESPKKSSPIWPRLIFAGIALTTVATCSTAALASTYGPIEPKPFVYPDRFTVLPDETLEQAQAKITKQRNCAKKWMLIGAVGGTALDIVTTQINQSAGYRESNPIYGKHASVGEQLLFNGLTSGWAYWRTMKAAKNNPYGACKTAKIYTGLKFIPGVANIAVRVRF